LVFWEGKEQRPQVKTRFSGAPGAFSHALAMALEGQNHAISARKALAKVGIATRGCFSFQTLSDAMSKSLRSRGFQ